MINHSRTIFCRHPKHTPLCFWKRESTDYLASEHVMDAAMLTGGVITLFPEVPSVCVGEMGGGAAIILYYTPLLWQLSTLLANEMLFHLSALKEY